MQAGFPTLLLQQGLSSGQVPQRRFELPLRAAQPCGHNLHQCQHCVPRQPLVGPRCQAGALSLLTGRGLLLRRVHLLGRQRGLPRVWLLRAVLGLPRVLLL